MIYENVSEAIDKGIMIVLIIVGVYAPLAQMNLSMDDKVWKVIFWIEVIIVFTLILRLMYRRLNMSKLFEVSILSSFFAVFSLVLSIGVYDNNTHIWSFILLILPVSVVIMNVRTYIFLNALIYIGTFFTVGRSNYVMQKKITIFVLVSLGIIISYLVRKSFINIINSLSDKMEDLEFAQDELKSLNDELEERVIERTSELDASIDELHSAQEQLVQHSKLASLGSLVAGVAHEINTPLGVGITTSSYLTSLVKEMSLDYSLGNLSKNKFEEFTRSMLESTDILNTALDRSAILVKDFKSIATDQSSYIMKEFYAHEHLNNIMVSLSSKFINRKIRVENEIDDNFKVVGYPEILDQILTNLIMNSLVHGYSQEEEGRITINFFEYQKNYKLIYKDDGCGMNEDTMKLIFDPFFTTDRGQGSGLGMYIVYNLVVESLKGRIIIIDNAEKGVCFEIEFPMLLKSSLKK